MRASSTDSQGYCEFR